MAIIEVPIKVGCRDDIADKVIDALKGESFPDRLADLLAAEVDTDNISTEVSGMPMKRLV